MKAQEYLLLKGIRHIHQPTKFYNLTIAEMIDFLEDFAQKEKESILKIMDVGFGDIHNFMEAYFPVFHDDFLKINLPIKHGKPMPPSRNYAPIRKNDKQQTESEPTKRLDQNG